MPLAMFLVSIATIAIGALLFWKNQVTDYERKTAFIREPQLAAALSQVRFWRRSWRYLGAWLMAMGVAAFFFSFVLLARS